MSQSPNSVPVPVTPPTEEPYDLSYLLDDPMSAVENYQELLVVCLGADNPHAHYIQGIFEYFHNRNSALGLRHLKRSADGKFDTATYLYGLLMIARGDWVRGKRYLLKLGWKSSMRKADQCWTQVKKSLKQFHIEREDCFVDNMFLLKPARRCHVNSFDRRCRRCFLYKQVMKFVDFI